MATLRKALKEGRKNGTTVKLGTIKNGEFRQVPPKYFKGDVEITKPKSKTKKK